MKRNPVGWFEIYVNDMDRARQFYETVLGVKLTELKSPDPGLNPDASLKMLTFPMEQDLPGCTGALASMEGGQPTGNGVIIYFTCEDCAVEAKRAASAGGRIHKDKFAIGEHGFIALVADPESNIIGLHSMK